MGQDDDETDNILWEMYTADIEKIGPANVVRDDSNVRRDASIQTPASKNNNKDRNNPICHDALEDFGNDLKPMLSQSGDAKKPAQLDKRTAMRLKRGQIPLDARIDLHGLYQRDAKTQLLGFIAQSFQQGARCVLVITGKGQLVFEGETPENNTPGVIKRNFRLWLKEEPYASMILKIEKAQIKDGGEGAYYILLRRRR